MYTHPTPCISNICPRLFPSSSTTDPICTSGTSTVATCKKSIIENNDLKKVDSLIFSKNIFFIKQQVIEKILLPHFPLSDIIQPRHTHWSSFIFVYHPLCFSQTEKKGYVNQKFTSYGSNTLSFTILLITLGGPTMNSYPSLRLKCMLFQKIAYRRNGRATT